MNKETKVKREYDRLKTVFRSIPADQQTVIDGLMKQAAFMRITLEELEEQINASGTVDIYQHGKNQSGTKASAELQAYNQTVKNYSAVISQLVKLVPAAEKAEVKQNSLMKLLNESKKKDMETAQNQF